MAEVYVSSTIIDLVEERQAVEDWLRLARHQAVGLIVYAGERADTALLVALANGNLFP